MKVVVTGRPYGVGGKGVVAEVGDAVVAEVADAVVAEVAEVEEAAGPAGRPGQPMPMSLFQYTRKAELPIHKIGRSSLHLCDGGMVQTIPKSIALRMQN